MQTFLIPFYRVKDFFCPPRLRVRYEPSHVKNMLPSYDLVPDDCSDSEVDVLVENGQTQLSSKEKDVNQMETTVRICIKDTQPEIKTENLSMIVDESPSIKLHGVDQTQKSAEGSGVSQYLQ